MAQTLRRGLPRVQGGDRWPPAEVAVRFAAAGAGATPIAMPTGVVGSAPFAASGQRLRRGLPRVSGGAEWPPAEALVALAVEVPADWRRAASSSHSAPKAGTTTILRRGLPRHAGGDGWPPASVRPVFGLPAVPAGVAEVSGEAVAAPTPSAPVSPPVPPPATRPKRDPRFTGSQVFGGLAALVGIGAVLLVLAAAVVLLVRMLLYGSQAGTDFLAAYPGASQLPEGTPAGFPAWVQWQHWLNAFLIILIIKTGWTVRTSTRPAATWQLRGGIGKKVSIEIFIHVFFDVIWLVNGIAFWVLLFATGQWVRVVPTSWDVIPNAVSAALQYASLDWPTDDGWVNYNALQLLTYFLTVFIAAPLAAVTGVRMSPLWPSRAERLSKAYPLELARRIHFPVMLYFVLFIAVHVVLVLATGALRNLNHMFWGSDDGGSWGGFWMFVLGIAATIGALLALRPVVVQQLGAVFGKVGR